MRPPTRAVLVAVGGGCCAFALTLFLVRGEGVAATIAAVSAQVLGDIASVGLASVVALRSTGIARAAWSCIAGAFAFWLLSDSGYLAATVTGRDLGLTSLADIGWVGYVVLILAAVALIYLMLRPERGWHGALDTLALASALCAMVWAISLGPLALTERIGTVATTLSLLYPASALIAAMAVAWLVLRTRGGPLWLRWGLAALVVQFAGEATFLAQVAGDDDREYFVLAWVLFAATSWLWAIAAHVRLSAPAAEPSRDENPAPPIWSDTVPVVATLTAVGVLAWPHGALGAVIFTAAALASVRLIIANRTNARLLSERHAESLTDPLTGAHNRRALDRELSVLTARSRRSGAKLSAVAIDLDGFKAVNDTRGHVHGDRLLAAVVDAMGSQLRAGDLLFRVGGDEFVVLLPDTPADEALVVAERLRVAAGEAAVALAAGVTASIGVAEGPTRRSPPEALLADADRALYRAKELGRDRVMLSPLPRLSEQGATITGA
jgi:diguanylate cyclase (GGDEF)-like protein